MSTRQKSGFWRAITDLVQNPVQLYRAIGLITGVCVLAFTNAFPEDAHDPFWMRVVIAAICFVVVGASFVIPWVKENADWAAYFVLYTIAFWVFYINWKNEMQVEYVFGFYLNIFISSLIFRRITGLLIFAGLNLLFAILILIWVEEPRFPPGIFIAFFSFLIVLCTILMGGQIYAREALKRGKSSLGSIFEGSPDAIFLIHAGSCVIQNCNSRSEALLGLRMDQILNHALWEILPENFQPSGCQLMKSRVTDEEDFHEEMELKLQNGKIVWGDVVIRNIKWGKSRRWLLRISDITDKKLAENSLQLSDEILTNVPSLVLVTTPDAKVIYASPSITEILGYKPNEVLGDNWWHLSRPNEEEALRSKQSIADFAQSEHLNLVEHTERVNLAKNGEKKYISWALSMTSVGNVIGVGTDVTEERREGFRREVIYNISEASLQAKSPMEFYRFIHSELIRSLNAYNIYIALYDAADDLIIFPYYADKNYSDDYSPIERRRKAKNGLTEFILTEKKPYLLSGEDIIRLASEGHFEAQGEIPKQWMAVPLMDADEVIGVIATQDYKNADSFDEKDLDLLNFISGQLAHVISKLRADEVVRQNQKLYRAITEAAFEGIALMDEKDEIVECNPVFAEMFGLEEGEMVGKKLVDLIKGKDRNEVLIHLKVGDGLRREFTGLGAGGQEIFLEGIGLEQQQGGKDMILLAVRDISEKKKTQEAEAAARLDARFRSYVQNSSEIISILNLKGIVQYTSPSINRILGADPEAFMGGQFDQFTHQDDREKLRAAFDELIDKKLEHSDVEFRVQNASGEWRVLQSVLTNLLNDPMVEGILMSSRDITDRIKAAEQLSTSLSTIRATFDNTKDGILVVDLEGQAIDYNRQFLEFFELPEDIIYDVNARMEHAFNAVQDRNFFKRRMRDLMTGEVENDSFFLDMKNGRVGEVYVRPLMVDGVKRGRLWFFHDITEVKRAQDELANYLGVLETTFDLATDGVQVVSVAHETLNYNRLFLEIWDLEEMEFINGTPDEQYRMGLDQVTTKEAFRDTFFKVKEDPSIETFDVQELISGKIVERYSKPLEIGGEITGRVWFFRDVTERIRTNRALVENEVMFRSLFSQANDAIFLLGEDGFTECNQRSFEMFGATREEILGKTPMDFSPELQPDGSVSREKAMAFVQATLAGEPQFFGWKHVKMDGTPFDAEVSLNLVQIGDEKFVQAMVRDISEQVVTGNALRMSERRNKAILDSIPDMMFRTTPEGQLMDFKPGTGNEMVELPENLLDSRLHDIFPEEIADELTKRMQNALEAGETDEFEFEFEAPNGDVVDYEVRLTPSGQNELLIILRNVTERKRTEKELIKRNFELDSFVYRASHDLKAPLSSLMGLIRLATSDIGSERMPTYLEMMDKSVSKLDSFIKDLTDFSRNARTETSHIEIDFRETIYDVTDNLKFMDNADQVKIELEIEQEEPFYSDPLRMGIVFNNLISNAVKYFNSSSDKSWVRIVVKTTPERALIEIRDNGIGIGEHHLPKIFDLFYRATGESFGSGLGLYIVKNAVEKLKGTIRLESELGMGTTFYLSIPNNPPAKG